MIDFKVLAVVLLAVGADLALGAWLLFARSASPIDAKRFVRAGLAVGALLLLQLAFLRFFQRSFLLIHVAYVFTMVLVPLVGLLLLAAARRRPVARAVRACAWASLALVPVGIDATFVEPFRLVEESTVIPVPRARIGAMPLAIGVLADIQCVRVGPREHEAVARVMARRPELILIPGDVAQGPSVEHEIEAFRALLHPLEAPLGVWLVLGNTDREHTARAMIAGTHVELLHNRVVALDRGGQRVTLGGVDLMFASPAARAVLRELEQDPRADDLRLLLAHRPDVILALQQPSRVDLVIAGHTHGGQVQIPFFGPPITLSDVPRAVAAGGFHRTVSAPIYVSRGIGWEHDDAPRVRFLCPPEISFLTLAGE